jgi:hypothetical protein
MRATFLKSADDRKKYRFAPENEVKFLAKWWDLPPTVGE